MSTRRSFMSLIVAVFGLLGCNRLGGKADPKVSDGSELAQGPLDDVWTTQLYWRKKVTATMRFRFPGWYGCGRCEFPMNIVKGHTTTYEWSAGYYETADGQRYRMPSRGCSPLCEDCWSDLQTAENRLPYYEVLMKVWRRDGVKEETVAAVLQAVRDEKTPHRMW